MARSVIMVIDQGTSATKAFLFDQNLRQIHSEKIRHQTFRPRTRWAEADPEEIVEACLRLIRSIMTLCASESFLLAGAGMAFQRSTFLFFDRTTGIPLTPAMSWQDSRAKKLTDDFAHQSDTIQEITGIPLTPHFGGPKFLFAIRNDPDLGSLVKSGDVLFSPVSTFVTQRLTSNALIDESIAGRTMLLNLKKMTWDPALLSLFEIPEHALPELVPTCGEFGKIHMDGVSVPLLCVMGDQQASLVGRGRSKVGDVAMNFGTSGSVLVYTGEHRRIVPSLLCNVLYSFDTERHFLLEGTINSVSSVFRWLEGYLNISHKQMQWASRCTESTQGILLPGINGIASPYWTGEFEPVLLGFGENASANEIVRAGMESIGFLVNDIWTIIQKRMGAQLKETIASGGSSKPVLLQFISDLITRPVWNSTQKDMTALGVARLVARQIWNGRVEKGVHPRQKEFRPTMPSDLRRKKVALWHDALQQLSIAGKPE